MTGTGHCTADHAAQFPRALPAPFPSGLSARRVHITRELEVCAGHRPDSGPAEMDANSWRTDAHANILVHKSASQCWPSDTLFPWCECWRSGDLLARTVSVPDGLGVCSSDYPVSVFYNSLVPSLTDKPNKIREL